MPAGLALIVKGNDFISPHPGGVVLRSKVTDGPVGAIGRDAYVQLTWADLAALLGEVPALSYGDDFAAVAAVIRHLQNREVKTA